jgi:hypothetical protein
MKHASLLLVLTGIGCCFSSTQARAKQVGPPPPHPAVAVVGAAEDPRAFLVIAGSNRDTLEISRELTDQAFVSTARILGPEMARSIKFLEGGVLRTLDDKTPPGTYETPEGSRITVLPGTGYPRSVDVVIRRTRELIFKYDSGERLGVLVTEVGQRTDAESYLHALRTTPFSRALSDQDHVTAYEVPSDGPLRASISLGHFRTRPVQIAWFAYPGAGETSPRSGLVRNGNRAEWRVERAPAPKDYPIALARHVTGVRLLGRALVHPVTGDVRVIP